MPAIARARMFGARCPSQSSRPLVAGAHPIRTMPVLALDAGTTSTRAMVFADDGAVLAQVQKPFGQHFPADGWVEHDADEIFATTVACAREALAAAKLAAKDVAGIGIAVQRETVVVWDRATGKPVQRAIVWQDRRTAERCRELASDPAAVELVGRTGLLLDPYFSATKLAWILDEVPGARARAERGELLAGTIDTWLLWKLTGGKRARHRRDERVAHAAVRHLPAAVGRGAVRRCSACRSSILPTVRDSADDFGSTTPDVFGAPIMVRAMIGDQQAGAVGQDCVAPGEAKATYGTGCFVLVHTGDAARVSRHRLLGTVALRLAGVVTYALEGSIFNAGTVVQWLRDQLGLIEHARGERDGRGEHSVVRRRVLHSRVHGTRRAVVGSRRARRADRPHARQRPRAHRARRARVGGVPDARSRERVRRGRRAARARCAWTAAWRRTSG